MRVSFSLNKCLCVAPMQQKDFGKQRGVKGGRAGEGVRVIQILMF